MKQIQEVLKQLIIPLILTVICYQVPTLRYMTWLFSSIIHEGGHTLFAWFAGCPALPAINLTGHAAAFHQQQNVYLAILVLLSLIILAIAIWKNRYPRPLFWLVVGIGISYPFLAFISVLRETGHLLAGHSAELLFAMIFFWRAHTGYFIQSQADRTANYFAALYLAIDNICLTAGILFVPSLRAYYYTNASFGLTNDYIRLADQWFSSTLWPVAAVMLLLSLLCLPAAFFIAEYITGSNKEIE